MSEKLIAVCVPTFMRDNLLRECLLSIAELTLPRGHTINVVVADNDVNATARKTSNSMAATLPFTLHYFVHPKRGLSEVRNRLLDEALAMNASLIAFVDDDERVDRQWLLRHIENMEKYKADVCCGPVRQVGEVSQKEKRKPTGSIPRYVSTNNVLFKSALVSDQHLSFDPFFNFIGGEDFDFFDRSKNNGNSHIWVEEALVLETITEERDNLSYLFYRHYTGGINNVLRFRRSHPWWQAWLKFLPRFLGKIVGACVYLLCAALRMNKPLAFNSVKKLASGMGYIAGLLNIVVERYREPDGKTRANSDS
ncbi:MAG: glycosyltransferase [Gammaproteobacteria bacterium]|nr:glycosyltransferase [Gammaproteobacteria bacterium]